MVLNHTEGLEMVVNPTETTDTVPISTVVLKNGFELRSMETVVIPAKTLKNVSEPNLHIGSDRKLN